MVAHTAHDFEVHLHSFRSDAFLGPRRVFGSLCVKSILALIPSGAPVPSGKHLEVFCVNDSDLMLREGDKPVRFIDRLNYFVSRMGFWHRLPAIPAVFGRGYQRGECWRSAQLIRLA